MNRIREAVEHELLLSKSANSPTQAFQHLERAHVIGQELTREHCRVHWAMLIWGLRNRSLKEVVGQLFRLLGAFTKTAVGFVPKGNTGGANISPFRSMPIPEDLRSIIANAKSSD